LLQRLDLPACDLRIVLDLPAGQFARLQHAADQAVRLGDGVLRRRRQRDPPRVGRVAGLGDLRAPRLLRE